MTPEIFINGRFMTGRPVATYAVARHLTVALARRMTNGQSALEPGQITVLAPPDATPEDIGLPVRTVGRLTGTAWEQVSLPRSAKGQLLLNFAGRSPLGARNAMTMVHDAQVFTHPSSYSRAFRTSLRANIRLAGRMQRGLLTVSAFAKSELVSLGIAPADRIHVIPNGVDHVLNTPGDDRILLRHGLRRKGYALALSTTQPLKNIGVLLRAFATPALATFTLVLAGRATADDFARAGHPVPPNAIFAGYVTDGEMRALQAQALAICTPSLTEGFGLPPVEGLLLGTPAVISPCGALPEVCGPGALKAAPDAPGAWAEALTQLQQDPHLRQGLSAAGQQCAAQFTWDAAAATLETVLTRVLR